MLYLEIAGVSWVEIPSQLSVNLGANEKDHCAESAKKVKVDLPSGMLLTLTAHTGQEH